MATNVNNNPTNRQIEFNNKFFTLKFSDKNSSGAYINEYYKNKENGYNWTELLTVIYYPKSKYTPIQFAKALISRQPKVDGFENIIVENKETKDISTVFFLVGNEKKYDYFEFNAIKILSVKNGRNTGLKTIQYAKKYKFTDRETCNSKFNSMKKYRMTYLNKVYDTQMPEIYKEKYKGW